MKAFLLLRNISLYVLLVLSILIGAFALVSGAEEGAGIRGIIRNSPNALPWMVLLILVLIAWKKTLAGGILITLLGIAAMLFFLIRFNHFFLFTFFLLLGIILLGILLIISGWMVKKEKK